MLKKLKFFIIIFLMIMILITPISDAIPLEKVRSSNQQEISQQEFRALLKKQLAIETLLNLGIPLDQVKKMINLLSNAGFFWKEAFVEEDVLEAVKIIYRLIDKCAYCKSLVRVLEEQIKKGWYGDWAMEEMEKEYGSFPSHPLLSKQIAVEYLMELNILLHWDVFVIMLREMNKKPLRDKSAWPSVYLDWFYDIFFDLESNRNKPVFSQEEMRRLDLLIGWKIWLNRIIPEEPESIDIFMWGDPIPIGAICGAVAGACGVKILKIAEKGKWLEKLKKVRLRRGIRRGVRSIGKRAEYAFKLRKVTGKIAIILGRKELNLSLIKIFGPETTLSAKQQFEFLYKILDLVNWSLKHKFMRQFIDEEWLEYFLKNRFHIWSYEEALAHGIELPARVSRQTCRWGVILNEDLYRSGDYSTTYVFFHELWHEIAYKRFGHSKFAAEKYFNKFLRCTPIEEGFAEFFSRHFLIVRYDITESISLYNYMSESGVGFYTGYRDIIYKLYLALSLKLEKMGIKNGKDEAMRILARVYCRRDFSLLDNYFEKGWLDRIAQKLAKTDQSSMNQVLKEINDELKKMIDELLGYSFE